MMCVGGCASVDFSFSSKFQSYVWGMFTVFRLFICKCGYIPGKLFSQLHLSFSFAVPHHFVLTEHCQVSIFPIAMWDPSCGRCISLQPGPQCDRLSRVCGTVFSYASTTVLLVFFGHCQLLMLSGFYVCCSRAAKTLLMLHQWPLSVHRTLEQLAVMIHTTRMFGLVTLELVITPEDTI